jgi:hypothetical protein
MIDLSIFINIIYELALEHVEKQYSVCRIWGFHSGDYEECRFLECDAV